MLENSIKLMPIRKKELDNILQELNFSKINYYGNFKGDDWGEDSLHLIIEAIV